MHTITHASVESREQNTAQLRCGQIFKLQRGILNPLSARVFYCATGRQNPMGICVSEHS